MADQYIYRINYQNYEKDLCALDMRGLFGVYKGDKIFTSKLKITPSISPFIKHRLELMYRSTSFRYILHQLSMNVIVAQGFSVQYVPFIKNDPLEKKGKEFCKAIGMEILGFPNFKQPSVVYGITFYNGLWYFGILVSNDMLWKAHIKKPYSYSSSLGIHLAKVLLNVVSGGDRSQRLMDPCCGVGTVLIEGAYAGYAIEGREIKEKVANNARKNLHHFGYEVPVTTGDIRAIKNHYDGVIIDLPYGNFSHITPEDQAMIIANAQRIGERIIIVASEDISQIIKDLSLKVLDTCSVGKNEKGRFERQVYLCQ